MLPKFHVVWAGLSQKLCNPLCLTLQHSWESLLAGYVVSARFMLSLVSQVVLVSSAG